jgi:tRNA pseudouridine55 synthase
LDGVLIIDKRPGWTSHDVVAKIRNILKIKKVGHAGTLDPFATGVLPLTIGRATRLTNYFLTSDKTYNGTMRFGVATDTYDVDGKPVGEATAPDLEFSRLQEIFSRYRGTLQQTLPPYSAKKVRGRPLYSYARQGVEITPPTKTVTIKLLELVAVDGCDARFELECSAGTYARSLAHDIGKEYGCGAHLMSLRRIRSGEFRIEKAVPLGNDANFHPQDFFLDRIIPLKDLLQEIPSIVISEGDKARILNGIDLNLLTTDSEAEEFRLIDESGELISLARRVQVFASPLSQSAHWVRVHPHLTFQS